MPSPARRNVFYNRQCQNLDGEKGSWERGGVSMDLITREEVERREHETLSPDAAFSDSSLGRGRVEEPDPFRTCFQRDRDRILHSKSFRRLAYKTQVFLAPEGDHYRTRLIHTLEVSQIARSIARSLRLNEALTEAIALGHDLGHTPFGHTGERALSRSIALYRGIDPGTPEGRSLFRHNEQSVRILEHLEHGGEGLNLSIEVLDGIRCHTGDQRAITLEGRVVAIADRVAYVTHDIDDAERAGLLTEDMLPQGPRKVLGDSTSARISTMVRDLVRTSAREGDICMSDEVYGAMMEMRSFLFENIYTQGVAKEEEPKANMMISELFDHYVNNLDEISDELLRASTEPPELRTADFVSGMTDRYAIRTYERLKVPSAWKPSL